MDHSNSSRTKLQSWTVSACFVSIAQRNTTHCSVSSYSACTISVATLVSMSDPGAADTLTILSTTPGSDNPSRSVSPAAASISSFPVGPLWRSRQGEPEFRPKSPECSDTANIFEQPSFPRKKVRSLFHCQDIFKDFGIWRYGVSTHSLTRAVLDGVRELKRAILVEEDVVEAAVEDLAVPGTL